MVVPGRDSGTPPNLAALLGQVGQMRGSGPRRRGPFGCVGCLGILGVILVGTYAAFRFTPLPILVYVNPLPYFGQYSWVVHPGQTAVNAIAFSPDGRLVASVGEEHTLDVWDASTGRTVSTYRAAPNTIAALVVWSPEGNAVAIGDSADALIVVDAVSGQKRFNVPGFGSSGSIAWSPDGKRIATADQGTVRLWDGASGSSIRSFDAPTADVVAWSPDGTYLAAAGQNGDLWVWSGSTPQPVLTIPHQTLFDFAESVRWSPDGKRFALAISSQTDAHVSVYDVPAGTVTLTYRVDRTHSASLVAAWAPDSRRLAIGGTTDGSATIWDAATGQKLRSYGGHGTFDILTRDYGSTSHLTVVEVLSWSPRGTLMATLGSDDSVQVWNPDDGRPVYVYDTESGYTRSTPNGALTMAWSPDGTRIAVGGDRFAEIWKPR